MYNRKAREEPERVVMLVGPDVYNNDPVVHAALVNVLHGVEVEAALANAVRCLSLAREKLMKDLIAIAASRPVPMMVPDKRESP